MAAYTPLLLAARRGIIPGFPVPWENVPLLRRALASQPGWAPICLRTAGALHVFRPDAAFTTSDGARMGLDRTHRAAFLAALRGRRFKAITPSDAIALGTLRSFDEPSRDIPLGAVSPDQAPAFLLFWPRDALASTAVVVQDDAEARALEIVLRSCDPDLRMMRNETPLPPLMPSARVSELARAWHFYRRAGLLTALGAFLAAWLGLALLPVGWALGYWNPLWTWPLMIAPLGASVFFVPRLLRARQPGASSQRADRSLTRLDKRTTPAASRQS